METNIGNSKTSHNGRVMAGVIILFIGGLLLADQFDLFFIPHWLFSWPMWIIAYGVYMGGKYNFRKPIWAIMIVIGTVFLFSENVDHSARVIWPLAIIGTGLYMVVKHNKQVDADYPGNNFKEI